MLLESIGADARVRAAFESYAAPGLLLARVAFSQRDQYRILTAMGELEAEPSGALWYRTPDRAGMPVVGDWVAARDAGGGMALVEAVLPRKTLFSRRAAGRRDDEQPIAANIDRLFLICGLDGDFNLRRLERYLTLAAESGAEPVVVLNKSDVCADLRARLAEAAAVAGGAPVVPASTRAEGGLDGLRAFLGPGKTVALLGSSGVGKSSIVNCILGRELLRTNEVRESDSRGRHTTTWRELLPLPEGGALIDTPGMRELQLWAREESVDRAFEEIVDIAAGCRFRDCSHSVESGCAVTQAIEQGLIGEERWNSYRKLKSEARRHEELTDHVAAAQSKRKLKAINRAMKKFYRDS